MLIYKKRALQSQIRVAFFGRKPLNGVAKEGAG